MSRATILLVLVLACTGSSPTSTHPTTDSLFTSPETTIPEATASSTLRGVALSPRSFEAEDLTTFLDLATSAGEVLMHAGDWLELREGSAFELVAIEGAALGSKVMLVVSWSSAGELIRPLDDASVTATLDTLEKFVARNQPAFLGIGNEINMLATDDPEGFEQTVDIFSKIARRVEAVSPATTVFPVFQYEWLLGLRGGLFGRQPGPDQWDLLDLFEPTDAVGFTTYPYLVHPDPSDLAEDYYTQIADHTSLPIIFTEVGWPAEPIDGFGGDEAEQAAFVRRFRELTAQLRPEVTVWPFVFDTQIDHPAFTSVGLRRPDGSARPAWDAWVGS